MNNKKWMAILLGGIMAASLAAPCSVSAAEKTTLTFWHAMGGTNGEVLQQIVDDFNASQDEIEVKAEYQGTYDDTITKLKAAMQSDSGLPDVCQMYDVGTKFMYDSGAVIPVEDKFESTGYDKSSVMGVISSYYTVDGKQYSMPFNVSTPMLYYNKDVFEAAGLDPETPPTTYDEVLEDAKKIVESGAAPVGYSQAIYGWFFEQQLAGLGVTYGNNDNGRTEAVTAVDFDSNGGGLKVFDMWKKLYDSGCFEDYGTTTADTQTAFFSGQVGMIIESTAILKMQLILLRSKLVQDIFRESSRMMKAVLSSVVDPCGLQIQATKLTKMQHGNSSSTSQLLMYRLNGPWVQDTLRSTRKLMRQRI